jgi:WD40 repeat protein
MPGIVELVSVSPGGNRALFFSAETPTPTPELGGDGVVRVIFRNVVDVWLWENGQSRLLGTLETCGPNEYMWTKDENFVAIQADSFPHIPCQESVGWLINIPQSHIYPVLPLDTFNNTSLIKGFSSNQDKLLFSEQTDSDGKFVIWIYVLMLGTLETVKLDTPDVSNSIAWIDNERLLISYSDNRFDPENIGIFDLQTGELVHLFDQEDVGSEGIVWEALSPDKDWLAFAGWEGNSSYTLWLMDLRTWEKSQLSP